MVFSTQTEDIVIYITAPFVASFAATGLYTVWHYREEESNETHVREASINEPLLSDDHNDATRNKY